MRKNSRMKMPKTVTYGDIQSATPEEDRVLCVYGVGRKMAKKSLSILEWGLGIGGKPEAVEGKQASTLKDTTASRKYWCAIWLLWWREYLKKK